jgi:hypothetical protein
MNPLLISRLGRIECMNPRLLASQDETRYAEFSFAAFAAPRFRSNDAEPVTLTNIANALDDFVAHSIASVDHAIGNRYDGEEFLAIVNEFQVAWDAEPFQGRTELVEWLLDRVERVLEVGELTATT